MSDSTNDNHGRVYVVDRVLSGSGLSIGDLETNSSGEMTATYDTFSGSTVIVTGGTCTANNNSPSTSCS